MSFWEILTLTATMATILGVFLTIYALINNKTLKTETQLTRELIDETRRQITNQLVKMDENTKEIMREIGKISKEILEKVS